MRRDASTQAAYDDAVVARVLDAIVPRLPTRRGPALVGISGLQGSGKSTFARQLADLAVSRGIITTVLALDDFYRGRRERIALARSVHPLLTTRGVPGTHDVALLRSTLDALGNASRSSPARVPRFDKGRDTRLPPSRWSRVLSAPRLILLEGWCVGVTAQTAPALRRNANHLEAREDTDRRWRSWVNAELGAHYMQLWRMLDALILIAAPDFSVVPRWRGESEQILRERRAPHAMSKPELQRFLMHYERLSRHALRTLPAQADVTIVLDALRRVRRVRIRSVHHRSGSTTTAVP